MPDLTSELVALGVVFGLSISQSLLKRIRFPPSPYINTALKLANALAVGAMVAVSIWYIYPTLNKLIAIGGIIGVIVFCYFFSPAGQAAPAPVESDPALFKTIWAGIRAPDINNGNIDMAHKAFNALNMTAQYWGDETPEAKQMIKAECFGAFEQWFNVLDSQDIPMSDGRPSKEHLNGRIRNTYEEMKTLA